MIFLTSIEQNYVDTYIPKYIYEYALALFRLMRDVRLEMLESVPPQALISA